jgi:PPOX class probable F420-dependent enzyme
MVALSNPSVSNQRTKASGSNPLTKLGRHWAVRLTTYRRDGTPVATAVNVAVDGDRVFFRTYEQAGKFKRLRNDPRVDVAPSTFRGEPTGPSTPARAHLLTGADDRRAAALIDQKHKVFQGMLVRAAHRLRGYTTRHFELLPVDREP